MSGCRLRDRDTSQCLVLEPPYRTPGASKYLGACLLNNLYLQECRLGFLSNHQCKFVGAAPSGISQTLDSL